MRIASPYDLEARYSSKRETHWVGYQVHLTEVGKRQRPNQLQPRWGIDLLNS